MFRLYTTMAVLVLGLFGMTASAPADDKDKKDGKPFAILKFMQKSFGNEEGYRHDLTDALKEKDFTAAAKHAKEWVAASKGLDKATPPKGSPESWGKFSGSLLKCLETLEKACKDKDKKAADAALKSMGMLCAQCHKAHKMK